MKLEIHKWYIAIDFVGERSIGLGWWRGSSKMLGWRTMYYDGNWFGFRIGPFFYTRGPY